MPNDAIAFRSPSRRKDPRTLRTRPSALVRKGRPAARSFPPSGKGKQGTAHALRSAIPKAERPKRLSLRKMQLRTLKRLPSRKSSFTNENFRPAKSAVRNNACLRQPLRVSEFLPIRRSAHVFRRKLHTGRVFIINLTCCFPSIFVIRAFPSQERLATPGKRRPTLFSTLWLLNNSGASLTTAECFLPLCRKYSFPVSPAGMVPMCHP